MRLVVILVAVGVALTACSPTESVSSSTESLASATTTPLPTTVPGSSVVTTAPTEPLGNGEFVAFDPAPPGRNWLQVSNRTGAFLDEEPELCLILDDGELGQIHAQNFALDWSGGEWTVTWRNAEGTFSGPVVGMVDGLNVTFDGETEGMTVKGSVVCLEP